MNFEKFVRAGQLRRLFVAERGQGRRLDISVRPEPGEDVSGTVYYKRTDLNRISTQETRHPLKPENVLTLPFESRDIEVSMISDRDAVVALKLQKPSWLRAMAGGITTAAMALSGVYLESAVQENQFI